MAGATTFVPSGHTKTKWFGAGSPVRVVDGWIARPTGPGLGIEVDEAAVRRAAEIGHAWRSPIWRHDDGVFAEW